MTLSYVQNDGILGLFFRLYSRNLTKVEYCKHIHTIPNFAISPTEIDDTLSLISYDSISIPYGLLFKIAIACLEIEVYGNALLAKALLAAHSDHSIIFNLITRFVLKLSVGITDGQCENVQLVKYVSTNSNMYDGKKKSKKVMESDDEDDYKKKTYSSDDS